MKIWNRGFTLTWLGHATFELVTKSGTTVLFDPWLANPRCPEDRRTVAKLDVLAISHAHSDHVADVVELATRFACPVICGTEVAAHFKTHGVTTCAGMGKGGTQRFGGIAFTMVHAVHSSSFAAPGRPYGGSEAGYVVTLEDDTRIYFAGDTGPTMDMVAIRELYAPEIAILPIGDHYTMGPREAAWAAGKVGARWVVPMHFGTFPELTGTVAGLRAAMVERGVAAEVVAPEPGEPLS